MHSPVVGQAPWGWRLWSAPAKRSGDGALASGLAGIQSGVVLRFPPQSIEASSTSGCTGRKRTHLGITTIAGELCWSLKGSENFSPGLSDAMPWEMTPNHTTGLKGRQNEAGGTTEIRRLWRPDRARPVYASHSQGIRPCPGLSSLGPLGRHLSPELREEPSLTCSSSRHQHAQGAGTHGELHRKMSDVFTFDLKGDGRRAGQFN
jgi:hypothetical protein